MSATAGPTIESIDPANGEVVATYEVFSEGQIDAALDLAHDAFADWRREARWSELFQFDRLDRAPHAHVPAQQVFRRT